MAKDYTLSIPKLYGTFYTSIDVFLNLRKNKLITKKLKLFF